MTIECEICQGQRFVRLQRHLPVLIHFTPEQVAELEQPFKDYPCPECSPELVKFIKVFVSDQVSIWNMPPLNPEHEQAMMRSAAHRFVDMLLKRGFISQEVRVEPPGSWNPKCEIISSIRAVHPKDWMPIEERIAERQMEVALEVVNQTEEEIANWGSYYHGRTGGSVQKWQALEWVQKAYQRIKEKRDAARRK